MQDKKKLEDLIRGVFEEPKTPNNRNAEQLKQLYDDYRNAGFNVDQAWQLTLLIAACATVKTLF